MKDVSKLTTLAALLLLVVALVTLKNGLPNIHFMSNTVFWILGGLLIWRLIGGGCCSKRGCTTAEPPSA